MALETDIYTAFWDAMRAYRNTTLNYIRGWFKADMENIPATSLPAICVYPISVNPQSREGGGDRFLLSFIVKGSLQHFDPMESPEGEKGRKGILDLYNDLDRVLFTMLPQSAVTVDGVTTTVQVFPIFTSVAAVRDINIRNATFSTESYEEDYPNVSVTIPVDIWYIKTDEIRRIT
jgi:hypothetical protein